MLSRSLAPVTPASRHVWCRRVHASALTSHLPGRGRAASLPGPDHGGHVASWIRLVRQPPPGGYRAPLLRPPTPGLIFLAAVGSCNAARTTDVVDRGPEIPQSLFQAHEIHPAAPWSTAWSVGSGTGQCTRMYERHRPPCLLHLPPSQESGAHIMLWQPPPFLPFHPVRL